MKVLRSTKCTFKFATEHKKQVWQSILQEYGHIVNFFINQFWDDTPGKYECNKKIYSLSNSWMSNRVKSMACREAIDMVNAAKKRRDNKPVHHGSSMQATQLITKLILTNNAQSFDAWLHVWCVGNKIALDLPIKFHKHFNYLNSQGTLLKGFLITKDYVQFIFEIETGTKKTEGQVLGLDTGVNQLATLSNGQQLGNLKPLITRINGCQHGSKRQKRLRRALKHKMDEIAKQITTSDIQLLVLENLKGLRYKTKQRLVKNVRCVIGTWTYGYWLDRLKQDCEWNRVSFRSVSPRNTSITCSSCGYTDKRNRDNETFRCLKCSHEDNADINASKNILQRFLSSPYGTGYQDYSNNRIIP